MTAAPASVRLRSFAKINLALSVLGRRSDGFHEIRTVLQSIDLSDQIDLRASETLRLCASGYATIESLPPEQNLVWKAALALSRACAPGRGADITLRKRIPPGAGLGGGSGNAAATLLGLQRLWGLEIPPDELRAIAASLGSDVPFFLEGGTALGVGLGEEVYPLPDLAATALAVVFPGVEIQTAEAYRLLSLGLTSERNANRIGSFCRHLASGAGCLTEIFNDFEAAILPAYPAVADARSFLQQCGAAAALLCGSGSSVFGFFSEEESALAVSRGVVRETWRAFPAKTLSRTDYLQRMFE